MDPNMRREILLDNYQHPEHHGLTEDPNYIKID